MLNRLFAVLLFFILTACSHPENQAPDSEQRGVSQMHLQKMSDIDSGYRSSERDWAAFLGCWRDAVNERVSKSGRAPWPVTVNRVDEGGTTSQHNQALLDELERSLGQKLPKSYRNFAAVTGGRWFVESVGDPAYPGTLTHLSPINSVGRFKDVDLLNWGIWSKAATAAGELDVPPEKYYRYGYSEKSDERQDISQFRWKYLDRLIKVGELEQGTVLLINPFEITSDGEWEAWMLSPQLAGARRYRSFAEMLQHIAYQDILQVGGTLLPPAKLRTTCAQYLKTAAIN